MLGQQTLFNRNGETAIDKGEFGKGTREKDSVLDKICHRYYYHEYIQRLRYDDCIYQLHLEFDLSIQVLVRKLKKRLALLDRLVEQKTTATELKKIYPWYDWNGQPIVRPPQ